MGFTLVLLLCRHEIEKPSVIYAANKANKLMGMLRCTFTYYDTGLAKQLYTTFIRPHLEFAVAAWNPYQKGDIDRLEKVQRRATRLIPAIRELPYEARLKIMGLSPLVLRRDLIQTYKILHGHGQVNWFSTTSFPLSTILTRDHSLKIQEREIDNNCDQRHHFFTNRIVAKWNSLPENAVSAMSVNSFKAQFDSAVQ